MKKNSRSSYPASFRQALCSKPDNQAGLTLLELMISLALGLLLLTGIGTIYVGSNQTYRVQEQNARIQESGRYALDVIGRSLRQAGYWDMPVGPTAPKIAFGGIPINGTDNSTNGTGFDTVVSQYDGVIGDRDCEGTGVTAATVITDAIRLTGTDLECDGIDAGTAFQPLVSNVEDLQFLYGIDNDGSLDQSANLYVTANNVANWNQVVSVRACVLIRSEEQGITTSAQSFLNCANALSGTSTLTAATDSRLRRTFVATFNLRNRVTNLP